MYIGQVKSGHQRQSQQHQKQPADGGRSASTVGPAQPPAKLPARGGSRGKLLPGLRREREDKTWAQEKLEEVTGVTQATISALELGKRTARWSTIRKLAAGLGVEPKDLMR